SGRRDRQAGPLAGPSPVTSTAVALSLSAAEALTLTAPVARTVAAEAIAVAVHVSVAITVAVTVSVAARPPAPAEAVAAAARVVAMHGEFGNRPGRRGFAFGARQRGANQRAVRRPARLHLFTIRLLGCRVSRLRLGLDASRLGRRLRGRLHDGRW